MGFKFLIVDTYYPAFLRWFYRQYPGIKHLPYDEQWQRLMNQSFGTADFYSMNLKKLGHDAKEVIANCESLQRQWASEHQLQFQYLDQRWLFQVLVAQVKEFCPDVLYIQDIGWTEEAFLAEIRPYVRLIIGQIACPLPNRNLQFYDLILTSFPHYVSIFQDMGIPSEYFRIAFEPEILKQLDSAQSTYKVIFIGSYTNEHLRGTKLLEEVAKCVSVDFWGYGVENLSPDSSIRQRYHGELWGLDMYHLLSKSKIVLNRHIDAAGQFANNMRLYEVTGVGTLLITDWKENLHELFEVGKEVVAYRDAQECIDSIKYYLDKEEERVNIASAGQKRTLQEHTYYHRMQELIDIVDRYLRQPKTHKQYPILQPQCISYGHRIIKKDDVTPDLISGWQDPSIPHQQRQLVNSELERMYKGDVVPVYKIAAEAIRKTGLENPFIIEVGCASGYYSEVLSHLLGCRLRYIGIDYSQALLLQARQYYPTLHFLLADAIDLPLKDECCDILFSPALLMHVPKYTQAIKESARVTKHFCIFHRTPVVSTTNTTFLSKYAYGVEVVELVFNESELINLFQRLGLELETTIILDQYHLDGISEEIFMKTYVCRKR